MLPPPTQESVVLSAYVAVLATMGLFGLHRLLLLAHFRWGSDRVPPASEDELPRVAVQLPLYNERHVAERLLRATGRLRYPRELLEVQVLDDSTDDTRAIVDAAAEALRAEGVRVRVLRRERREGYKAGALEAGLRASDAEFVAVFDADFLPEPDFLLELLPAFRDPRVGMVQARWGHQNRDDSTLTRAQSTLLDGHFVVEHKVRYDRRLFFNFNGTAGIWRRAAIEEAGGWQHDTLTEDLDLSYRAQLAGWRFVYAHQVVAPAEVPPDIAAFKSQQHRWAKGSAQVLRKLAGRIGRARVPLAVKLEALAHLGGNVGYPCLLVLALLMPLAVRRLEDMAAWWNPLLFCVGSLSAILFYERGQRVLGRPLLRRAADTLAALALGIGMSLAQTRAVLEGLFGDTGEFVRTPKRGEGAGVAYSVRSRGLRGLEPALELGVAAWLGWGVVQGASQGLWGALPFLLLFLTGFAWVGGMSLAHALGDARRAGPPARASAAGVGATGVGAAGVPGAVEVRAR